jgi:hypothetical protein
MLINISLLLSKRIRFYILACLALMICYIILLACHLVFELLAGFVNIFGFIRFVKSLLILFVVKEAIDTCIYFNRSINITKKGGLEKKATLNIEVVLQILNNLKGNCYGAERDNIDYCIKIISNNKLFIPKIFEENKDDDNPNETNLKNEIAFWVQNFEKIEKLLSEEDLEILRRERSRIERLDTARQIIDQLKVSDIEQLNLGFSNMISSAESEKIVRSLMKCFNLDFNVFVLKEASNGQELLAMMYYVFYHLDYFNLFNIRTTKYINFAKRIQESYHNNPYHNATHAADVLQVI